MYLQLCPNVNRINSSGHAFRITDGMYSCYANDQLIGKLLATASVDYVRCPADTTHPNGLFRKQAVLKAAFYEPKNVRTRGMNRSKRSWCGQ